MNDRQAGNASEVRAAEGPLGRLASQVAAWSQLGTFLLLGWGYFYTVQPVYQRDRLQEELSRLQSEIEHLRNEAAIAIASKVATEQRVESAQALLARAAHEVEALHDTRWELDRQISSKNQELETLSRSLHNAIGEVNTERARSEQTQLQLIRTYLVFGLMREPNEFSIPRTESLDRQELIANHLEGQWIDYSERVPEFLSRMASGWSEQLSIEKDFFDAKFVEFKGRFLSDPERCRVPDFNAWGDSAKVALSIADEAHKRECGEQSDAAFRMWLDLAGIEFKDVEKHRATPWWPALEERVRSCPETEAQNVAVRFTTKFDEAAATCAAFAVSQLARALVPDGGTLEVDWSKIDPPDPAMLVDASEP